MRFYSLLLTVHLLAEIKADKIGHFCKEMEVFFASFHMKPRQNHFRLAALS